MTDPLVGETAAKLYGLSIALDTAADHPVPRDVSLWIAQGNGLMRSVGERGEPIDDLRTFVHLADASATFLRAWSRHEAGDKALGIIAGAEVLERLREAALTPVSDA